jgi:murein DD-endopeptidase MepM/ murein hydrolase activator NlpD
MLTGALDSLDQGSIIPLDRIVVTGTSVRLELKAVGGTFEGVLNAAGTELKGTWTQAAALPLMFLRDGPPPAPPSAGAAPPAPSPFGLPLDMSVPIAPTPFVGNDRQTYLVYEVHLTNFSARDLLVEKFEVLQDDNVLASSEGSDLNAMMLLPGSASPDRRTLPAGRRAVVFLWFPFQKLPTSLRHRVSAGGISVVGAAIAPSSTSPVTIGPPLGGPDWMAANGPGRASGHRRALLPIDGRARIAQRFAIDWVRMGPTGTFTGDQKDNKSYRAYGAEALAVADAVVAATKDGIPENVPGITSRAVPITLETIGGNHVVLDLGGGRFAFYAHLQPGSLRVKTGDRVKRGQVIGLVGNSGNSTEPHLHFHVSDGVSPLGSEGLPYAIAGMTGMPLQNERVTFKK